MMPEIKVLILNAVLLGMAYFAIYPAMNIRRITQMLPVDLLLLVIALLAAGSLFYGQGIDFSLLIFDTGSDLLTTNWFFFTVLSMALIEAPLFLWYCRKNDIDLNGGER